MEEIKFNFLCVKPSSLLRKIFVDTITVVVTHLLFCLG